MLARFEREYGFFRPIIKEVVIEPFAAHPSYALGYYDCDNQFYVEWARISKDRASSQISGSIISCRELMRRS